MGVVDCSRTAPTQISKYTDAQVLYIKCYSICTLPPRILPQTHGSVGKQSACHVGDLGSIPGLGRSPGEGKGYPSTPVFWLTEFYELYSPWGRKELYMTE